MELEAENSTVMNEEKNNGALILRKSNLRKICKDKGYSIEKSFFDAFDADVKILLDKIMQRARNNGRKRIMRKDI